jgi:hypothetical protein
MNQILHLRKVVNTGTKKSILKNLFFSAFVLVLLIIGILIHKDYGISWDEPQQRLIGFINFNYVSDYLKLNLENPPNSPPDIEKLENFKDRDYGVIFELPAVLLEHIFTFKDIQEVYFARHLLTFLVFIGGVIAVYQMAARRFSDWRMGVIAAVLIILSPRIFAESFYNNKDLVFLSFFAIAVNTAIIFILRPSWQTALLHALASAIAIDTRIMAIIVPCATLLIVTLQTLKGERLWSKSLQLLALYFFVMVGLVIVFWPFLWSDPLGHFLEALGNMAKFRWAPRIIFEAEYVKASNLPWHYVPTWISITTPPLYLVLFAIGCLGILKNCILNIRYLWRNDNQLQDLIFMGFCIGPVIAVIALHSVLYNGWRHVYFIYPTFILITVVGLHWLWSAVKFSNILKTIIAIIVIGSLANTSVWMIQNHPLQNLYFNSLTKDWDKKYEVDYWGLAYKPLLEAILRQDASQSISIFPGNGYQWRGGWQLPFTQTLLSLNENNRSKISSPSLESEATYSITSAQARKNIEAFKKDYRYSLFDQIRIDATVVLAVFKKIENPILPIPNLSESIIFGEYEKGSYYLISNSWQEPENWGVWSKDKQSSLHIPTPENASSISFYLRALVSDKYPNQLIDIYINNRLIKSISLVKASGNVIEIPIEKNDLQSNFIDIKFKFKNPIRPIDLGINEDDRVLAIGLESMMVK